MRVQLVGISHSTNELSMTTLRVLCTTNGVAEPVIR